MMGATKPALKRNDSIGLEPPNKKRLAPLLSDRHNLSGTDLGEAQAQWIGRRY